MNFQQISSREYHDFDATFEKNTPPVYCKFEFLLNYALFFTKCQFCEFITKYAIFSIIYAHFGQGGGIWEGLQNLH